MSREEPRGWANTRSFFYGAEATAQSAYDAMGAAIQEAEDVVEGAFEMIEESIDHEMQGWHEKLPVHPFKPCWRWTRRLHYYLSSAAASWRCLLDSSRF